jgi:hypothetical protein
MKKAIVVFLGLLLLVSTAALCGQNFDIAKGIVHVRDHNAKAGCNYGTFSSCEDIVTTLAGHSIDAFPVFYELTEYQGCEYGLLWPAWQYSAAWNNCSPLVIGSILLSGQGASHTWLTCQFDGYCVPAFIWLYADGPGQICITGHPEHGSAFILDCHEAVDVLIGWGCAGVYGVSGHDPCGELPEPATVPTTWGDIKSLFE